MEKAIALQKLTVRVRVSLMPPRSTILSQTENIKLINPPPSEVAFFMQGILNVKLL